MYKANEWEIFYSEISNNRCQFLAYNSLSEEFYHIDEVDKSLIYYTDKEGNKSEPILVSDDIISRILLTNENFEYEGFPWDDDDEPEYESSKELIPKELIHKAIRCEISFKEIGNIRLSELDIENDDYFNYNAYINTIHRFMHDEIGTQEYIDWAVVCLMALQSNSFEEHSELSKIYDSLALSFDGHAFCDFDKDTKKVDCRRMISEIKEANHIIQNIHCKKDTPFYNNDGVIVYTLFDHCNQDNIYFKICVIDEMHHKFRIGYAINPDFLETINYSSISKFDFDNLTNKYYEYIEDETIDFSKYIAKIERIYW